MKDKRLINLMKDFSIWFYKNFNYKEDEVEFHWYGASLINDLPTRVEVVEKSSGIVLIEKKVNDFKELSK